jgi:hypothetical protein
LRIFIVPEIIQNEVIKSLNTWLKKGSGGPFNCRVKKN